MYENIKITARMQAGIITDIYLPLDSIIFYQVCREYFGFENITEANKSKKDLPYWNLDKIFEKKNGIYKASFGIFGNNRESKTFYTKRFDIDKSDIIEFGKGTQKIQKSGGRYKLYNIEHYYFATDKIYWYAKANIEELNRYLKFLFFIGKKTSQGWGAVLNWEIERIKEDYSFYKDKKPTRSIPKENGSELYGIRPSYWDAKNQAKCILPDKNDILKNLIKED